MAITVSGTEITFDDATTQSTAAVAGGGFTGMQKFNSPGTFTTPANTSNVQLVMISGGGGGGGVSGGCPAGSNSGFGGEGLIVAGIYPVAASTPFAVTVGAAGNGGAGGPGNSSTAGGAGGVSSFGSLLTVNGGNGGGRVFCGSGTPGNTGTAGPTAQISQNVPARAFALDINSGSPGAPKPGGGGNFVGGAGGAGTVLVYF